ncbi:MAG: helix-turn-helix domain-containing protein [Saprospiraceae bacterium]
MRYQKKAYKKDTQKRIEKLLDGGSAIRAVANQLKISPTTVLKIKHQLEKSYQEQINRPYIIPKNVMHRG